MPVYEYFCAKCDKNFEQYFNTLPSEKKQKEFPCNDCDEIGVRILSNFNAGNTQSSGMEKAMGRNALNIDVGGRPMPAFQDANGKVHEVRRMEDIEHWQKSNQLGHARMVEWRNPKTGEKTWEPQRIKMVAGPDGMPLDLPTVKESVPLVPVDHFEMPTVTRNDIPIDPKTGVIDHKRVANATIGPRGRQLLDPDTGKPLKVSMWGDEPGHGGDNSRVRAILKKK